MIELLSKEVTAFSSNIDVWHGSEFASDYDALTFSNHTSIQNMFFLGIKSKRKIWVIKLHQLHSSIHSFKKKPGNALKNIVVHSKMPGFQIG